MSRLLAELHPVAQPSSYRIGTINKHEIRVPYQITDSPVTSDYTDVSDATECSIPPADPDSQPSGRPDTIALDATRPDDPNISSIWASGGIVRTN